ncbi:MAG: methylmalonyl Co-A mutase-associated GTPase MeaB [Candidatus Marinimicrobia bacterium]|nr:methylmalonyl Co-A mutase-associated GTPase MeaB [Candidatus Neomarinimicrobiota bacterium]
MQNLANQILKQDIRAIARSISLIENETDISQKEALIDTLHPHCGNAIVWGITGPPGAGKSSLLDRFIEHLRQSNKKVAVIAVDPSSPFSGGAILGDRLRMQKHATDDGVFIRSMASRGHLGGVAGATADAIKVFDAAGFDYVIIETIGVGQTEIEVMELSDIVLLVLVPGLGDEIQAMKAGVMEIGDIFIINKKDLDGADRLKSEIEYVLSLKDSMESASNHSICMTSATQNDGIGDALAQIHSYFSSLHDDGRLAQKRKERIEKELKHIATTKIMASANRFLNIDQRLNDWVEEVFQKKASPYKLLNKKIGEFLQELNWQ